MKERTCVCVWTVSAVHSCDLSKSEPRPLATATPVSPYEKKTNTTAPKYSFTCKLIKILIFFHVQIHSIWYRHPLLHTKKFKPKHSVMMTLCGARRPHDVATDYPDPCCVCEWVLKLRLKHPLAWEARQWAHMGTWLSGKCQNRCTSHLPGVNATPARAPETMSSS